MAEITLDIDYTDKRSRVTSLFRTLLALPHLIVVGLLMYVAQLLTFVQWLIILFTGKRNQGIWNFCSGVLNWQSRAATYAGLMYDTYPAFSFQAGDEPVRFGATFEAEASRLTNVFRMLWAIPAIIIGMVVGVIGSIMTLVSWVVIVITGSQPRGMFDLLLKVHRYMARLNAYLLLLTDTYPSFS